MVDLMSLRLAIETVLGDELGAYTFTDGQTTAAIGIDTGSGNYPHQGTTANGLECVILFRPEVPIRPLLNNAFEETYAVQILLQQWDANKNTLAALSLILDAIVTLPEWALQSNSIRRVLPLDRLGNIETLSLTLTQTLLREA